MCFKWSELKTSTGFTAQGRWEEVAADLVTRVGLHLAELHSTTRGFGAFGFGGLSFVFIFHSPGDGHNGKSPSGMKQ